jgi:hypothetical protein
MKKIAIFHWGELTINAYYLAIELKKHNVGVDFFLYSPRKVYRRSFLKNLHTKLTEEFNTIEVKCSLFDSGLMKLNSISSFFSVQLSSLFVNPLLPIKTRRRFREGSYNYIITIGQTSLYWLYKTDASALKRTIHYSLEVQKVTDPHFINPAFAAILKWEAKLLQKVKGLIIQDELRAEALLDCKVNHYSLNFFFIPVSIPRLTDQKQTDYLNKNLDIPTSRKIILYFGEAYPERYINEISETVHKDLNDSWVLVVHGPNAFPGITKNDSKIRMSTNLLDYDSLHLIISSATIGLALYDNSWPNTRYTAFSSEKIARYLQVGVPFIAFRNESYLKLQNEFNCCFLIDDISDLTVAVQSIMERYELYKSNCYNAFEKYYDITKTVMPLVSFLK